MPAKSTSFTIHPTLCLGIFSLLQSARWLCLQSFVLSACLATLIVSCHPCTPSNAYSRHSCMPSNAYSHHLRMPSNAYSHHLRMPGNAFSRHLRMPGNAYSRHLHMPGNAYSRHLRMPGNAYSRHLRMPGNAYSRHLRMPGNAFSRHPCFPSYQHKPVTNVETVSWSSRNLTPRGKARRGTSVPSGKWPPLLYVWWTERRAHHCRPPLSLSMQPRSLCCCCFRALLSFSHGEAQLSPFMLFRSQKTGPAPTPPPDCCWWKLRDSVPPTSTKHKYSTSHTFPRKSNAESKSSVEMQHPVPSAAQTQQQRRTCTSTPPPPHSHPWVTPSKELTDHF